MIDLHTHTNHSDGRQTVAQLLQKAEQQGIKFLSITDHDTVGAYEELCDPKIRGIFSGEIISGVEIAFEHEGLRNELLGYFIDIDKIKRAKLLDLDHKIKNGIASLKNLYNLYAGFGFRLSPLDNVIKQFHKTGNWEIQIITEIDSEKNVDIIRDKLGCKDAYEFRKWRIENVVKRDGKYHVRQPESPTMDEVSKIIRDAGGKVFMAHVWRVGDMAMPMLEYAVKNKLIDGIECFYQEKSVGFTQEQTEYLIEYANQNNLLISGGSDSHKLDVPLANLPVDCLSDIFQGGRYV